MSIGFLLRPVPLECLYNALLDLEFTSHTKVIAFEDDLAVLTVKLHQKLKLIPT
jgi:hypothetical protein